jgi:Flp pilus assembly protein TadD
MKIQHNSTGSIILGMHRSGTSCLAGMLQLAGFHAGNVGEWQRDNQKGNRENLDVVELNDAILRSAGGAWHRPMFSLSPALEHFETARNIMSELSAKGIPWMFKDPRTLLTLEFWQEVVPDAQLIGLFRSPMAVAGSLSVRNGMPLHEGLRLWITYNQKLLDTVEQKEIPLLYFSPDTKRFMEATQQTISDCFPRQVADGIVNPSMMSKFLASDLVHQRSVPEDELVGQLCETGLSIEKAETLESLWLALADNAINDPRESQPKAQAKWSEELLSPLGVQTINNLAKSGQVEDALMRLEQALNISPERVDLWHLGIDIIHKHGNMESLEGWVDRALSSHKQEPFLLYEKAGILWNKGDRKEAVGIGEKAYQLAPRWLVKLEQLAYWYYVLEDWEAAARKLCLLPANLTGKLGLRSAPNFIQL